MEDPIPHEAFPIETTAVRSEAERDGRAGLKEFAAELGIPTRELPLLRQALTHRSLSEAQRAPSGQLDNERLEFLGDSILGMVVGEDLFQSHPEATEGQLTRMKARFVSEPALAHAAALMGMGALIEMAASEAASRGRDRPSVLSDAFEAVLAVIYLVNGLEPARRFIRDRLLAEIDPTEAWDHKSLLQELMQEKRRVTPTYRIEGEIGTPHDRKFIAEVLIKDQVFGRGTGRSKKVAEQAAAANALASVDRLGRRKGRRKG